MGKIIDLTSSKFGKVTVIKRGENDKQNKSQWWCECSCGNPDLILIRAASLKKNPKISCGCSRKGINKKTNIIHNFSEGIMIGYTANGDEFYFDEYNLDKIKQYSWHRHGGGYMRTCIGKKPNGRNKYMLMHKLLFDDYDNKLEIDHINGSPNDNVMENLRIVLHGDNMKNCKIYTNNTSGQKGVYYSNRECKWKASINCDRKTIHLGTFNNKEDAIEARLTAENKYFGEYMRDEEHLLNGTSGVLW